jgi:phosphoserine phosphatase
LILAPRAWLPANHQALAGWLERWRKQGGKKTAAFDFDNTTLFHDLGEAVMRLQLEELSLALSLQALERLLPEEVGGITTLHTGASLTDAKADILAAYDEVLGARARGDDPLGSDAHHELRAKVAWLYGALEDTPGIGARYAYPFLTRWLGGLTRSAARALAVRAASVGEREPIAFTSWQSAARGRLGQVSVRLRTGLRAVPEMRELMHALAGAGVEVFVISASQEQLVEGALEAFAYPVPQERVFGMRLEEERGVMLPVSVDAARHPATYREGKREIIERFLPAPPCLVAGDSDTDLEMLTGFEQTRVRLLIRRDVQGAVRALDDDERTLLQGRDEPGGRFRPARESLYLS